MSLDERKNSDIKEVIVHPVILLSVVDHYYRILKETKDSGRRVVGVLLGEYVGDVIEVTNCYAVPFEEDPKDKKVWFVDHVYNEQMFEMHQKINYKEIIVGWYSSGPKIRPHDIKINDVFRKYTQHPVFCVIDVSEKSETLGLPAEAYVMKEEVDIDGQLVKTFQKLNTSIKASLPEQIGVEFLLKDISDHSQSTIVKQSRDKITSLKAMIQRLNEVKEYLSNVIVNKLPPNPLIIANVQELFNYMPNYETEDMIKVLSNQTNDNYLLLYLNWILKTTMGLHKLIDNKVLMKETDKIKEERREEEKKNKEKQKEEEKDRAEKAELAKK